MTALPDPGRFEVEGPVKGARPIQARPIVQEFYWGYEIRPGEQVIDLYALFRIALLGIGFGCAVGALGVWLVPAMSFAGQALLGKAAISAALASFAFLILGSVSPGLRVGVQIDTRNGEVREVVTTATGKRRVLSAYGFDAVQGVSTRKGETRAQIVLDVAGAGLVPAGDGHPLALETLARRLRADLSQPAGEARIPNFAGPLVR